MEPGGSPPGGGEDQALPKVHQSWDHRTCTLQLSGSSHLYALHIHAVPQGLHSMQRSYAQGYLTRLARAWLPVANGYKGHIALYGQAHDTCLILDHHEGDQIR